MTRIAVVGAGIMGTNHVRVVRAIADCEVVAVVDRDEAKGQALAASADAEFLTSHEQLVGRVDAVVIAAASEFHDTIGVDLLNAGIDVLVEKPIALDVAGGERLIAAAEANARILAVGHVERFNSVVVELTRIVEDPVHLEFKRIGPYSPRISTDVALDLMIHDLDLALALVGSEVVGVHAVGQCVRSDSLDIVTALLRFANGVTASLTASRVGQTKIRHIEMTQRENFVVGDLLRQDVSIHRVDHIEYLAEGGSRYRQTGLLEIPFLENRGEPLAQELQDFVRAVRDRSQPRVTARAGVQALELALRVRELAAATG